MSAPRTYTPDIIVDSTSSSTPSLSGLVNQPTRVLPNGAIAYVLSTKVCYRLDKTLSTPSPGGSLGGLLGGMGGGVWVPVPGGTGMPSLSVGVRTNADKAITLTGVATFTAMPSSAGTFVSLGTGDSFTLDTASGRLTYRGVSDQLVMLVANATMYNGTTVIDTLMGVSLNGSTTALAQPQSEVSAPVTAGASSFYSMTIAGIVQLDSLDTIDIVFAGENSTLTVTKLSYTILPL